MLDELITEFEYAVIARASGFGTAERLESARKALANNAWRNVRDGMPPCDGERVYVGINTAGFAACFNDATPDGVCSMEGPELTTIQMSGLEWWRELDRPAALRDALAALEDKP
jgi:hypothetical protein